MSAATVRIPTEKRDILRIIAGIERVEIITRGKEEVETGVEGKGLDELADRGHAVRREAVPQARQED